MHALDYLDGYFLLSRLITAGFPTWKWREAKFNSWHIDLMYATSNLWKSLARKATQYWSYVQAQHLIFI
jgi:hypothetical protein